jgi:hypothetical protein
MTTTKNEMWFVCYYRVRPVEGRKTIEQLQIQDCPHTIMHAQDADRVDVIDGAGQRRTLKDCEYGLLTPNPL